MENRLVSSGTRYELSSCLGRGANASVFRARRMDVYGDLHQTVALKILHSWNSVQEWRDEFQSLLKVDSPHCVRIYGFDRTDAGLSLALEFVEGASLADLLHSPVAGQLAWEELAAQIAQGLIDLDRVGLCHGDLSPNNILVRRDGVVKLVDFGLANVRSDQRRATLAYAAPEVFWSQSELSVQGDLFALAKILSQHSPLRESPWVIETLGSPLGLRPWCSFVSSPRSREALALAVTRYQDWQRGQSQTAAVSLESQPGNRRWSIARSLSILIVGASISAGGSSAGRGLSGQGPKLRVLTRDHSKPILPPLWGTQDANNGRRIFGDSSGLN